MPASRGACPIIRRHCAHGACEASSRREEEAMSRHIVDDEQRRDRLGRCADPDPATPMRLGLRPRSLRVPADLGPRSGPAAWASAALALLDDVPASPASRRLASAHAALGTRHILILGQAPRSKAAGDAGTSSRPPRRRPKGSRALNSDSSHEGTNERTPLF